MNAVRLAAAGIAGGALVVTLPGGGGLFGAAVLLWGGVVLAELAGLLGVGRRRPLLPASAVAALGMPIGMMTSRDPGWERIPGLMALAVLAAFVLALVSPRKRDVTVIVAATLLPALVIGLGTAGMLVLRSVGGGFRWTLGLLLLTVVPVGSAAMAHRFAAPATQTPIRVVSAGAIGGGLLFGAAPPFGLLSAVLLTGAGLAAGWAAAALIAVLPGPAGAPEAAHQPVSVALVLLTAPLLAAPVAAFLAFATQV